MSCNVVVDYSGLVLWSFGGTLDLIEDPERYVVEYSTGLPDKEGREIYQGDIVKGIRNRIGVCEFYCGRFSIKYSDNIRLTFIYENRNKIKKIGNIHENQELLKD